MPELLETTIDKFIFKVAADRLYSAEGAWALENGSGRVRVGVSDYVQQRSGDAAFVHCRAIGTSVACGDELAEVETIKANVSVMAPLAGRIIAINGELELHAELINSDAYEKGWLVEIAADDWDGDRTKLLDAANYLAVMRTQAEAELESP